MQLDLPAPVAPAMRMCGISARLAMTARPAMSRPTADLARVRGPAGLLAGEDVAEGHELALRVRHLDADRRAARDGRQDAHVGRRHRVGDVLREAGDPVDLHARAELELVAGDGRADGGADEAGLHAVGGEGQLEGAAELLDHALVDLLVGAALQQRQRRQLPLARLGGRAEVDGQLVGVDLRHRRRHLDLDRRALEGDDLGDVLVELVVGEVERRVGLRRRDAEVVGSMVVTSSISSRSPSVSSQRTPVRTRPPTGRATVPTWVRAARGVVRLKIRTAARATTSSTTVAPAVARNDCSPEPTRAPICPPSSFSDQHRRRARRRRRSGA